MFLALALHAAWAGAAPADCAALRSAYREAVQAAQVCDLKAPGSCAALRMGALEDACRCQVSVNPERTQALDRLAADFQAQGCAPAPAICNRMCQAPVSACSSVSGQQALCGRH